MNRYESRYFRRYHQSAPEPQLESFEDAFGYDPFTGEPTPEDPAGDSTPPAGDPPTGDPPAADPPAAPQAPEPAPPGAPAPTPEPPPEGEPAAPQQPAGWQAEMAQRGFAPDAFNEVGWRTYRSLEQAFSSRQTQPDPPAAPPAPPPSPILPGNVGEIRTQEDLYTFAQADPRAAAMFAVENRPRLTDDQFNTVMTHWGQSDPWGMTQFMAAATTEMAQQQAAEASEAQQAFYRDQIQDLGIAAAIEELPMIETYREQLGGFLEANPHLNDWLESLSSPEEIKGGITTLFYQMAGPQLAAQILQQQVQSQVQQQAAAAAAEEQRIADEAALAANGRAGSMRRNSAEPPSRTPGAQDGNSDEDIQARILASASGSSIRSQASKLAKDRA